MQEKTVLQSLRLHSEYFLTCLALLPVAFVGCQNSNDQSLKLSKPTGPAKVNAFKPERLEQSVKTVSYFGTLEPNQRQTLGFAAGGKVVNVPVAQAVFAAGDTVAKLDQAELIAQLENVQGQLDEIPAQNRQSDPAKAQQRQADALTQKVSERTIEAPFDCIVEKAYVSANSLVGPKAPVVTLVETTTPLIDIRFPRRISKLVSPEQPYTFYVDGQTITASLRERAFTEESPGSIRLLFDITSDLTKVDFSLGQTVEARLNFATEQAGSWLPLSSLRQNSNGLWSVYFVEQSDRGARARQQIVEIEHLRDDDAFVSTDLNDKHIIRDGLHRIVPGQEIEINIDESETANKENRF